jgi:hypothetical protein
LSGHWIAEPQSDKTRCATDAWMHLEFSDSLVLMTIKTKGFTPKTKATRYFARVAGSRLEKIIHE